MGFVKSLLGNSGGAGFKAQGADPAQMSTAYNQTQNSIAQQNAFVQALQAQNGIGNQSQVFNQQQQLSGQLQGVINGTGPNPAQAQLAQSTGANVSNQAAMMAGQRGASANTGLIARQAAQQGANTQQQAAGQAATLQAQQSLGAMGQLQQQQANMGNLASNQVANQQAANTNLGQQSLQQQSNLLGLQQNANSANASIASENAKSQSNMLGNVMGGLGSAAMLIGSGGAAAPMLMAGEASQGLMNTAAEGGQVVDGKIGPQSFTAKHILGIKMARGGKVPALVSPGERYLNPKEVEKVAEGKKAPMKAGEKIPGKAKVEGAKNSYSNDTVHKNLDEGGIVIPRSVTQGKNPEKAAHDFVSAILAKDGKRLPKKGK